MLLRTTQKSGKLDWSVGLMNIIPIKKQPLPIKMLNKLHILKKQHMYGSLCGRKERVVLDLESLGIIGRRKYIALWGGHSKDEMCEGKRLSQSDP